jgi:BlaI family penicillinase repressor
MSDGEGTIVFGDEASLLLSTSPMVRASADRDAVAAFGRLPDGRPRLGRTGCLRPNRRCGRSGRMRPSVTLEIDRTPQGSKMDDSLPDLGDLEREVMQLVWAHAPVTAEAVRVRLSRPLKESTVRTVLRRLEDKGYTTHTVDGRTYVYQAAEPRGQVAAKAVQRIVDWFCNGSVEEVLVGMVDNAMLDQRQLRMLADQVAKARAKGDKS